MNRSHQACRDSLTIPFSWLNKLLQTSPATHPICAHTCPWLTADVSWCHMSSNHQWQTENLQTEISYKCTWKKGNLRLVIDDTGAEMKPGLQHLHKQGGIPIPYKPDSQSALNSHQLWNGPKEPWLRHNASNLDLLEYDLSPLLQQNLLRSSLLRNSTAKIKANETSQGDETTPISTSASWGSACPLKRRICNAHAAKEDLLRVRASSSVQSATWIVGVHLGCFSQEHITAAHIITKMGLCRGVWHWCKRARTHIIFCWLSRAHLLVPLDPDM